MSINSTLRRTLILVSLVPILIVMVLVFRLISDRMVAITKENLKQLAETNSNGLDALIETQLTEVSLLATQSDINKLVSQNDYFTYASSADYKNTENRVSALLQHRSNTYPSCLGLTIYNQHKRAVVSTNEEIEGQIFNNSLTLSYMQTTKKSAQGVSGLINYGKKYSRSVYAIEIGAPIFDESSLHIIGYVVSTIDLTYFKDFINSIEMGKSGYGILLDKDGSIIYHPEKELIGSISKVENLRTLVKQYHTGEVTKSGIGKANYNGVASVYGYSIIPELNWVLVVRQEVDEIIDLAKIVLYILMLILVVLIILILWVSQTIANTFTSPLIELKDAMQVASDGNLEVQTNINLDNEFGELSKSFNKMLHMIKSNYYELSDMHRKLKTNEEKLRLNYNHIEYLAYHDILTKLPNKIAFMEKVEYILASSIDTSQMHAVYFIDLDNFKNVNDTLGHDYGDILLSQTAEKLLLLADSKNILARAGGDEFLIFSENISSMENAINYAASIIDAFAEPFDLNGEVAYVSMSIGISTFPYSGTTPQALIKNADIAMYKAKDSGKNQFVQFDNSMEEELSRNTYILEILRNAIQNKEVYVKYQPQYDINHNKIIGFEALMRINSVKLGALSPTEFIPIAEENGLIVILGEWILREACRFTKSLIDQGYPPYTVSVNISPVQINHPGFITTLEQILHETKLPPGLLDLEITETTFVSSIVDTTILLNQVQSLGVKISLDDFGTGYSSLNYLTSMPINTLKIDKSFIDNIFYNEKDSCIAEAIIQLAHSIELRVIAEGVETEHQLSILKDKKCDIVQGFIYSQPLLPSALVNML
ncbi:MAG: sensor-containing diguanylate cyclase/phosphodiesterase [Anaerocolumna sp.]|jgi:diguanylate cyclase (GGDEF)-like protein|nr:sensor-containing diguanylate cyclase/phosphodiesterase [Anaerocolumna sp.]